MYDMVDLSILPSEYLPDDYDGPTAGSIDDIIGMYGKCVVFSGDKLLGNWLDSVLVI